MLYIVTALYEEALPFFKKYNLKRKTDFPHFELFAGEEALLLITRPGALRAATALSSVLTAFPPGKQDFLLSVGCAGCGEEALSGKAFLICRITEGDFHCHLLCRTGVFKFCVRNNVCVIAARHILNSLDTASFFRCCFILDGCH